MIWFLVHLYQENLVFAEIGDNICNEDIIVKIESESENDSTKDYRDFWRTQNTVRRRVLNYCRENGESLRREPYAQMYLYDENTNFLFCRNNKVIQNFEKSHKSYWIFWRSQLLQWLTFSKNI